MSLYRKKPIAVEACQFTRQNGPELAVWCGGHYDPASVLEREGPTLTIGTLEGPITYHVGWWVIKGAKGEFYAVKPDIFEATYEPAGDTP